VFVYVGMYPSEFLARDDYEIVKDLHAAGAEGSYDAAVITKDAKGKVHENKDETSTRHGAWGRRGRCARRVVVRARRWARSPEVVCLTARTPSGRAMKGAPMRFRVVSSLTILAIVFLAACGSSSKSHATTTTVPKKNVNVVTPDGQVSLSLDGQLPPNWPSSFPVPSGATAAGSGSLVNGGSGVLIAVYSMTQPPVDAYNFYKSSSSLTVTKSGSVGAGDKYVGTLQLGGTYAGSNITIVAAGTGSNIVVTLKSGSSTATT
jgi:hypothetical protein